MPTTQPLPPVFAVDGVIKHYDWGSLELLQELLNKPGDGQPWAEFWLGTHASGMAAARIAQAAIPLGELLSEPLPFLFKILGIAKPLSVQVHPSLEQAQRGFDAETAAGVPLGAPYRVFVDRHDKPEQICALSEVWALCGFRNLQEIAQLLAPLSVPLPLTVENPGDAFLALFDLDASTRRAVFSALDSIKNRPPDGDAWRWVFKLYEQKPNDITVLSPLYLNLVRLNKHESLFLGAGLIHAYLSGLAVEAMGASDNVIRAGLTSKHIDQSQLAQLVIRSATSVEILTGSIGVDGWTSWPSKSDYFQIKFTDQIARCGSISGPAVLVCVDGKIQLSQGSFHLEVNAGEAVFVLSSCEISGNGSVYACTLNPAATKQIP